MASTTSMIRCRAESVPIVMSVPQKSLSIEPTIPTMFRCEDFLASASLILPAQNKTRHVIEKKSVTSFCYLRGSLVSSPAFIRATSSPLHSVLNWLAGSGQTAVAPDHTQVGDAQLNQVTGRFHTTLSRAEVLTASTTDDSTTLKTKSHFSRS